MMGPGEDRGLHLEATGRLMLLLAIPILVGSIMWAVEFQTEKRSRAVEHTLRVQISLERMMLRLEDANSSLSAFNLGRGRHFPDPYTAAKNALNDEIANLRSLTSDNPHQLENLAQMMPLLERLLPPLQSKLEQSGGGGNQDAAEVVDGRQHILRESIRTIANGMYEDEEQLLRTREAALHQTVSEFKWSMFLGYAVIVMIVGSLHRSVKRHSRETKEAQGNLSRLNAELDERVRQRTEELRGSAATTRTLLDTASQAILAVDSDGAIVMANRMASQMFGYVADELIGRQQEILLPENLREIHRSHRARFNANPKARAMGIGMDLVGLRKNGSEFPIEVSLSSVNTGHGQLAVSFVSDITERKRTEAELKESEHRLRALAGSLMTAQEEERRNLARELHDDLTQQLAFLSIELGRLATELPSSTEAHERVFALQAQIMRTSAEVRRLSHGLHPSVIADFGLGIALEEFCAEFEAAHEVKVDFQGLIEESVLNDVSATCLYRVAQESLHNAVVHGRAKKICVTLSAGEGLLQLKVSDNGTGFSTDPVRSKPGLGVTSMVERVRLVGGSLKLASQPGNGTTVTAVIPLRERLNEAASHPSR